MTEQLPSQQNTALQQGTDAWHRDLPSAPAPSATAGGTGHDGHDGDGHHAGHDGHDGHGDGDDRHHHAHVPAWQRPLHHVKAGELDADTAQTKGMKRFEALSARHGGTEKIWLGENHVGAQMNSGDHHHGEAETGIYVVSGHPVFVFLNDGVEERIQTGPGDYIFVPPYVPHREENPNSQPAVVVLARSTQEGIVVNLPSLDTPVEIPTEAASTGPYNRPQGD